jgi:nucleoside phosphorylase
MTVDTIGLIAAMSQERDALLRLVKGVERVWLGALHAHRFALPGADCLLVTSGMGPRRAGEAARLLLDHGPMKAVVTYGIAGAVEPDLEVGDLVAAEAVCWLQDGSLGPLQPLSPWPVSARQEMIQRLAGSETRLFIGCAVTTMGSQWVGQAGSRLTHPVLEMETAGIREALIGSEVPLFSLRAVSDGPSAPLPIDLGRYMDADANLRVGQLLGTVVRHPGLLLSSRKVLANSRLAAHHAALAVLAGLERLASDRFL